MKSLVLYFSRADENYNVGYIDKGNTEVIAEYIQQITGSDIFKVERKIPYAKDYDSCINEAKIEIEDNAKPEIANTLESIDEYDIIYIGSPVYWGYMPRPLITQLEKLNWNGKTIKPFITHEGSGLASIPSQIKRICIGANVLDGIAIQGSTVNSAKSKIESWIK